MGFEIGSITVAMYDKQGKSNGGIGMGSSQADGKIDVIEFRSALTDVALQNFKQLDDTKKGKLFESIQDYSIKKEISNDNEFQNEIAKALNHLNNKINSGCSWQEEQFKNKNNYWSQFKWY